MERGVDTRIAVKQLYRKQLVIPAEHGSWSWLLVPFFVGGLVARDWNLAVNLVLVGGLAGFLMRQPAIAYMRVRAGRGRKADGPLAAGWASAFALIAALCLLGLLALGRWVLLWLLVPMAALFFLYLVAAHQRRASTRTLWMELAGAAGLAGAAPAAYIAATGRLDGTAWALWGLMAGQNVLGVLYVRLRIADTHGKSMQRIPILWAHVLILIFTALIVIFQSLPWLAIVPFAGFLFRAAWVTIQERPIANIKRFGFSEIGVEILGGALIIAAYWLV